MKSFFIAISVLIGTTIGVGIFGLPYVIAKIGFTPGMLYLIGLGLIILLLNLCYGEIVSRTKKNHQLPGYAKIYLGKWGEFVAILITCFGFYGALLAYLIMAGDFLHLILGKVFPLLSFDYSLIFFVFTTIAIFFGIKAIPKIEFLMVIFLLIIILIIFIFGFPQIKFENLLSMNLEYFFLPFGVILFALGGGSAIPIMEIVLKEKKFLLKKAIILGTLIPLIIYILFGLVCVGAIGQIMSENAIISLGNILGQKILFLGSIFGFFTTTASFLILGLSLKQIYHYDYNLNKTISTILVCFIPLLIFLFGWTDFIKIIGITGSFISGLAGIIIILIYWQAKTKGDDTPAYSMKIPYFLVYFIIAIFSLGIIYQILEICNGK
ncbi:MAG: aromatic amino acid transport family protein [Patescibacteria group bacterium]